ncbi:MAG TPA: hypothetical protein VKV96_16045 [Roseiarcus sp.]|nr:hypothetical protein [Roseiarcus sp.]
MRGRAKALARRVEGLSLENLLKFGSAPKLQRKGRSKSGSAMRRDLRFFAKEAFDRSVRRGGGQAAEQAFALKDEPKTGTVFGQPNTLVGAERLVADAAVRDRRVQEDKVQCTPRLQAAHDGDFDAVLQSSRVNSKGAALSLGYPPAGNIQIEQGGNRLRVRKILALKDLGELQNGVTDVDHGALSQMALQGR